MTEYKYNRCTITWNPAHGNFIFICGGKRCIYATGQPKQGSPCKCKYCTNSQIHTLFTCNSTVAQKNVMWLMKDQLDRKLAEMSGYNFSEVSLRQQDMIAQQAKIDFEEAVEETKRIGERLDQAIRETINSPEKGQELLSKTGMYQNGKLKKEFEDNE